MATTTVAGKAAEDDTLVLPTEHHSSADVGREIPQVDQDDDDNGKRAGINKEVSESGNQSKDQLVSEKSGVKGEEIVPGTEPSVQISAEAKKTMDGKRWADGVMLGKLGTKFFRTLTEYLEEYESDLEDDASESEDKVPIGTGKVQAKLATDSAGNNDSKPGGLKLEQEEAVGTGEGQAKLEKDNNDSLSGAEPPVPEPKYRNDLYKYQKDKYSGKWIPELIKSSHEDCPDMYEGQENGKEALSSTFEVTSMYSLSQNWEHEGDFKVNAKLGTFITIYSPGILACIRGVVDYYPMESFKGPWLVLKEPYCLLLHYKFELTQLLNQQDEQKISARAGEPELDQSQRLSIELRPLLAYLSTKYDLALAQERARWGKEVPTCTFEWLWLLFKPGTTVISLNDNIPYAYTVSAHDKEMTSDREEIMKPPVLHGARLNHITKLPHQLIVRLWSIDYDGKSLGRLQKTIIITPFEGEKPIEALPMIPVTQWKDAHGISRETLEDRLLKRGKEFFKLTKRTYCEYHGKAMSWPNRLINGRVMIDSELCYSEEAFRGVNRIQRPVLGFEEDEGRVESSAVERMRDLRLVAEPRNTTTRPGYLRTHPDDEIDPFKTKELTRKQYLICGGSVWGFVTKLRTWELLNVEELSPLVSKTDLIDDLVLDEDAKSMIKALSKSYTSQSETQSSQPGRWSADFIQNKGDGQIFLCMGNLGWGKLQCVSELTQRPLLSLTCGDLGIDPVAVERTLMQWLRLGTVWGAILLLDEADVYLESRRAQDLQRNSLVSIFLRALEYYQGILFLTSNRVGTFDDAFISRIHVIIHYPPFLPAQRTKIWNTFFRRLEKDRPNLRIKNSVYDFISSDEALQNLEWNGREIRNAFNTAVALAEYENDVEEFHGHMVVNLHRRHLESVVKMSKAFQLYLNKVHGADEGRRAKLERIRFDSTDISSMSAKI